jgi:hypothetical protein
MYAFTYKLEARDHPMCWVRIEVMSYSFDFPLTQTATMQQPLVHGGARLTAQTPFWRSWRQIRPG